MAMAWREMKGNGNTIFFNLLPAAIKPTILLIQLGALHKVFDCVDY